MGMNTAMDSSNILDLITRRQRLNQFTLVLMTVCALLLANYVKNRKNRKRVKWDCYSRVKIREITLHRMIYMTDTACIENTRMDRRCFLSLCRLLKEVGRLEPTNHMGVEELVAMFLHILAHDVKNRIIKRQFVWSGETINRQFNKVLLSVLHCHGALLKRPDPVPENSGDEKWNWFTKCLGALDGTHIKVNPLQADKPIYQTRKGEIATNVLGVCSQDAQFIYVLPGWEGSAADSRVLRDAISRANGLRVPKGYYYLCDAGRIPCSV